jgi:nuclear receptor interaction protein
VENCPSSGIENLTPSGHPYEPTLAVSGIDRTIKIFSPDAQAQRNARNGINIADPDAQANIVSDNHTGGNETTGSQELGLRSRKRMHDSYQIMSQNDVNRQGGMNEAFITVRAIQFLTMHRMRVSFSLWASWF